MPAARSYDLFTGQEGHTYAFRCRATDAGGTTGAYPSSANTSLKVDPAARALTPWWNTAYASKRNIPILNNMANVAMAPGYPVRLRFDGNTSPSASSSMGPPLPGPSAMTCV